jgi:hypothetical protein
MLEAWVLEEYYLLVVVIITLEFLDKYGIAM